MGSRLAVPAALIAVVLASAIARPAAADKAAELVKRGLAAYKAGKYAAAASALEKAYKLDHASDTLFAWAQAERLLGDCEAAIPLYKKLLEQTSDLNGGRLIRENLALCEPEPEPEHAAPPPPPPPEPEVKKPPDPEPEREPEPAPIREPAPPPTVIEHRGPGGVAIALIAGGTLGLGVGTGFFIASGNSADAAEDARTVEDYERLQSKADSQRTISFIAGGAGVALLGAGIVLAIRHSGTHEKTAVSIAPTAGGATVVVHGGF